jgi:hypothetical protein
MDEYAMTEQDLREEQLQQITGGCGACDHHASQRDEWQDLAANAQWLAEGHAARGARVTAQWAAGWADFFTGIAKQHQGKIDDRRGTPGHPPVGEGSSTAVPDLNQLRLH